MRSPAAQAGHGASLAGRLARFRSAYLRSVLRFAALRAAWLAAALLIAFCGLDVLFGLPAAARLVLDLVFVGLTVGSAALAWRCFARSSSRDRMVARLVEAEHPELGNRLVNALDFAERVDREPDRGTAALMRRELRGALRDVVAVQRPALVRAASLRVERLAALCLWGGVVVCGLALPRVPLAVLPRFALPFGDFPPYSPTRLTVDPAGARVEYGEPLDIEIRAAGRRPAAVSLVLSSPDRGRVTSLAAREVEPGVFEQSLEAVTEDLLYWAAIPGGRSRRYRISVIKTPRIEAAHVRLEYPAYAHLRPDVSPLMEERIRAYRGTRVTLSLTSNRPLSGGVFLRGGRPQTMQPAEAPHRVEATFQLDEAGDFQAWVIDVEGNGSTDRIRGQLQIRPDEKPEVVVVAPGKDSYATPGAVVPVEVQARDDLGITAVHLYRKVNEGQDRRTRLYRGEGRYRVVPVSEPLSMAELGVAPGDVIEYYATATDSAPGGPATASSRAFKLMVISEEQYAELVRRRMTAQQLRAKYARFMERLERLAEEQRRIREQTRLLAEALGEADPGAAERQRLRELRSAEAALAAGTRALAAALEREASAVPAFDVERDYKRELARYAERVRRAGEHMDDGETALGRAHAARAGDAARAGVASCLSSQDAALALIEEDARRFAEGIDQAGEEIALLFDLYRDVEIFKRLLARQEAVARQSRFLASRSDPAFDDRVRLRDLAEEQQSIGAALTRLKQALREHAEPVREQYPRVAADAEAIAAQIEKLRIESLMETAVSHFVAVQGGPAHEAAQAAYEAMLSMVSRCKGGQGQASAQCERRLRIAMGMELGRTLAQLAQSLRYGMAGGLGGMGLGSAGVGGSIQLPYGLYGGSDVTNDLLSESPAPGYGGGGGGRGSSARAPVESETEDLDVGARSDLKLELPGGEHIMQEYKRVIVEYFTRMAEEP